MPFGAGSLSMACRGLPLIETGTAVGVGVLVGDGLGVAVAVCVAVGVMDGVGVMVAVGCRLGDGVVVGGWGLDWPTAAGSCRLQALKSRIPSSKKGKVKAWLVLNLFIDEGGRIA